MKTSQFCPRFGEVAIELGYITPEQLKEALTEQTNDDIASKPQDSSEQYCLKKAG